MIIYIDNIGRFSANLLQGKSGNQGLFDGENHGS
jgi:hypothetical protein